MCIPVKCSHPLTKRHNNTHNKQLNSLPFPKNDILLLRTFTSRTSYTIFSSCVRDTNDATTTTTTAHCRSGCSSLCCAVSGAVPYGTAFRDQLPPKRYAREHCSHISRFGMLLTCAVARKVLSLEYIAKHTAQNTEYTHTHNTTHTIDIDNNARMLSACIV